MRRVCALLLVGLVCMAFMVGCAQEEATEVPAAPETEVAADVAVDAGEEAADASEEAVDEAAEEATEAVDDAAAETMEGSEEK